MKQESQDWLKILFCWRGSVIPAILPQVAICALFSLFISLIDVRGFNLGLPLAGGIVPSIVLGLLLVFRTNTAYERFWEGRKIWGAIVNTSRNLARSIWVSIEERNSEDTGEKIAALRLLIAFAVAMKLHLRSEPVSPELARLLEGDRYEKLKEMNNPPLEIAFWLGDYLQRQQDTDRVNSYQLVAMFKLLDILVDSLGACERILKTPIPLAYAIHLKQLLFIYCLTLPFQVVNELKLWTAFFVSLVSFTVFGIEAIGIEIENPFGHDRNDLPLDKICETMERNIEDLISLSPSANRWK
ncbi:bestrophin family ion channel [Pannus brasiliensis CCIBt3594]|uniref:Bestrophin family ion channel n=1 Tax=Pannus brasiliensis CCIBt3594 TaxID=1427578 RepID=A0AAW9QH11_9CHRO